MSKISEEKNMYDKIFNLIIIRNESKCRGNEAHRNSETGFYIKQVAI